MARSIIRLIVPDSHGAHIHPGARRAILHDAKALQPDEIVWLGDQLDCAGTFTTHQRTYTSEMAEAYEDDCQHANSLYDDMAKACPKADQDQLEGNHEQHVERWASRTFTTKRDADMLIERFGPARMLDLRRRGIRYFKRSEHYQGISIPGTIRKGRCFFTHGISHGEHATSEHLKRFGANVVHGHTHRAQSDVIRTVTHDALGAWCPGTLAKLQPLYRHTAPTKWTLGYGLQFVAKSGTFVHLNVPIFGDRSNLLELVNMIGRRSRRA
jgi:hypothetical protein